MTVAATQALPAFEGQSVHKTQLRITKAGDGLSEALAMEPRAYHAGQEIHLVLRAVITQVNHKAEKDGDLLVRVHTAEAQEMALVEARTIEEYLAENRKRLREGRDAAAGQESLLDGKDQPEVAAPAHKGRLSVASDDDDDAGQ